MTKAPRFSVGPFRLLHLIGQWCVFRRVWWAEAATYRTFLMAQPHFDFNYIANLRAS